MTAPERSGSFDPFTREAMLHEVAEVLTDIEQAMESAAEAQKRAALAMGCDDLARVLGTSVRNLEAARKDLFQGAYFAADQPRLV
jgi:citrate lyase beta subunit